MKSLKQHLGFGLVLSILGHGLLICLLLINLKAESQVPAAGGKIPAAVDAKNRQAHGHPIDLVAKQDIVQAAVIDSQAIDAEIKRQALQEKMQKEEFHKAALAKKEREREQAKIVELKKELAQAKKEEEARLAEIKLAKEKERKQLEALKQEKEKEQKQKAALDEQKQKLEQEKSNQSQQGQQPAQQPVQQEDSKPKQAALPAKVDAAKSAQSSGTVQAHPSREGEGMVAEARRQWLNSEVLRFQALFRDKVNHSWIRAPGLPQGLVCILEIRLLPDGSVSGVKIANTSGNVAFDQAAEAAVQKASPLPVPKDPELMDKFRHFTFEFKPPEAV